MAEGTAAEKIVVGECKNKQKYPDTDTNTETHGHRHRHKYIHTVIPVNMKALPSVLL